MNVLLAPQDNVHNDAKTEVIAYICEYLREKREYREDYLEYLLFADEIFAHDPFEVVQNFDKDKVVDFITELYTAYAECSAQDKQDVSDKWKHVEKCVRELDEPALLSDGYDMCAIRIIEQLSHMLQIVPPVRYN